MERLTGGREQNCNLVAVVARLINSQNVGGLNGLARLFNERGQGDKFASWISAGENHAISPEEVQGVLGQNRVQQVASTSGMSEEEAARGLARVLPEFVDKLTPAGRLPEGRSVDVALSQLVSRFLRH
jgi:uncharacterized protein YidB (DUF937 family)